MTQDAIVVLPAMVRLVEASTLQRAIEHLIASQIALGQADQWATTLAQAIPPDAGAERRIESYTDGAARIDAIIALLNAALTNATSMSEAVVNVKDAPDVAEPDVATGPPDAYAKRREAIEAALPTHGVNELVGFACRSCNAVFQALVRADGSTICPSCSSDKTERTSNVVSIQKRATK